MEVDGLLPCFQVAPLEPNLTWLYFSRYSMNVSLDRGSVATTLTLDHALKQHSGNYTCAVGSLASATVSVHILNGKTG